MLKSSRIQWSWAFYDWANSAFATTVMAGFFPVFFKQYWAADLSAVDSTFWLGLANSVAAIIVVMISPAIGSLADRYGLKKQILAVVAMLGIVMSGGLFLVDQGHWILALCLYVFAVLGFSTSNIAYDAMLPEITEKHQLEKISALGFALGYLGGGILFAVNVWSVLDPAAFGLSDSSEAVRWSFISVAIWWAIFSLPVLFFFKEKRKTVVVDLSLFNEYKKIFRELLSLPMATTFLLAYWFYIDGVDTIVRMAVDYGLSLGFDSNGLLTALLITQAVGFPAAIGFGWLGHRIGAKKGIWIAIGAYLVIVLWAAQMQSTWEFYALAIGIGLVQGGIQALSRALFTRLIPISKAGQFFGLYNMMGKFAAVLGPLLVGLVTLISGNPRFGIMSILILFAFGAFFLRKVDVAVGERQASDF